MKKWMKENVFIVLALCIMGVLFYSSSQPYSAQTSVPFLEKWLPNEPFKEALSSISFHYGTGEVSIEQLGYAKFLEFFIRKAAHFGTYFLLASFWYLGLRGKQVAQKFPAPLLGILIAAGYAISDELHQGLTTGRSPMVLDVCLDTVGASVGVGLCFLVIWFRKRRKEG